MACNLTENRRRILLNTPHVATASGNPVLFSTDIPTNFGYYNVLFGPTQNGSGTPSPTNIRSIPNPGSITITINSQTYAVGIPSKANAKYSFVGGKIKENGAFLPSHVYYKWGSGFSASFVTSISTVGSYTRFWLFADGSVARTKNTVPICNILPSAPSQGYALYNTEQNMIGCSDDYPRSFWCIMPTSLVGSTASTIRNYLAGKIEIAYQCDVGESYYTTCPNFIIERGNNSISHNLSGSCEVKYWTH